MDPSRHAVVRKVIGDVSDRPISRSVITVAAGAVQRMFADPTTRDVSGGLPLLRSAAAKREHREWFWVAFGLVTDLVTWEDAGQSTEPASQNRIRQPPRQ